MQRSARACLPRALSAQAYVGDWPGVFDCNGVFASWQAGCGPALLSGPHPVDARHVDRRTSPTPLFVPHHLQCGCARQPGRGLDRRTPVRAAGRWTGDRPTVKGHVIEGGVDWQWRRDDGVLEISAHYVIRADDGGLIEVRSEGLRHGPPRT